MTCSATPAPTHVLKKYSNPSFLTHPVNYLVDHDGYEEFREFGSVVEPTRHAKRSLFKKTIKKKTLPLFGTVVGGVVLCDQIIPGPGPCGPVIGVGAVAKVGKKGIASPLGLGLAGLTLASAGPLTLASAPLFIKGTKGIAKLGPKGLAGLTLASAPLTLASAPLALTLKKPILLKAAPKLVKKGPKVAPKVGPLAKGPLALGAKTIPAGGKVLKTAPLLAPALLKKGPLAAGPLLLPLAGKAAKSKKLAIPAVLLKSQSQGGGSQRRGSSSSSGGNRTRGCNRNGSSYSRNGGRNNQNDRGHNDGSSCKGEEDTRPAQDKATTRAPTEEEKEAALEAQAALEEAQITIKEAKAAMQKALAAMRGARLGDLNLGRK